MKVDYQERADELLSRSMAYSFFADVFNTEVTRDFMAQMKDFSALEGSKLSQFVSSLQDADLGEVTQDVRSEFCALFLNMSAHPVFTSESVYVSDNHIIMQEPRNQVVKAYRECGLAVDKEKFDWPEDHISMEFLFMAHLCEQERLLCLEAMRLGIDGDLNEDIGALHNVQKNFFESHIALWVPLFIGELEARAKTMFYAGIAEYLREFMAEEKAYLDDTLQMW